LRYVVKFSYQLFINNTSLGIDLRELLRSLAAILITAETHNTRNVAEGFRSRYETAGLHLSYTANKITLISDAELKFAFRWQEMNLTAFPQELLGWNLKFVLKIVGG
jgi:hypothetical protein